MTEPFVVLRPREVALVRPHLAAPEILDQVKAVSVLGGDRLPANDARFSYGFRGPEAVGLVLSDDSRHRVDDARAVLIRGGRAERETIGGGGNSRRLIVEPSEVGLPEIANFKAASPYIDEVDKYLQDKERAHRQVGGDEFYARVQMQNQKHADLHLSAPFSRLQPPSVVGSVMGGTAQVNDTDNVDITTAPVVAYWNGENEESTPVTVTLGVVQRLTSSFPKSNAIFDPVGFISWGTRGNPLTALVDMGQGCQFTVGASFITVRVGMTNNASGAAMLLSGMLSFFPIVRTVPITKTIDLPGDNSTITIPAFAKRVMLLKTDDTMSTTLTFVPPASGGSVDVVIGASTLMVPIPIPNIMTFVKASAGLLTGKLVFELSL